MLPSHAISVPVQGFRGAIEGYRCVLDICQKLQIWLGIGLVLIFLDFVLRSPLEVLT